MSSDRSLSDMRALCGRSTMPPWLKTFQLVHLKPEWQMYAAQLVSVCHMWPYCESKGLEKRTCWQNLQVQVQSFQVQVQVPRAQVQVQQKWT